MFNLMANKTLGKSFSNLTSVSKSLHEAPIYKYLSTYRFIPGVFESRSSLNWEQHPENCETGTSYQRFVRIYFEGALVSKNFTRQPATIFPKIYPLKRKGTIAPLLIPLIVILCLRLNH